MLTENLDTFFDSSLRGHAVDATYNGATAVKVVFDQPYIAESGIGGTNPSCLGKSSDFPAAAIGKNLLVGAVTFKIIARQPVDDGAIVRLQLEG